MTRETFIWAAIAFAVPALMVGAIVIRHDSPPYAVHVIDSCEYIVTDEGGIVHKENCSNPLHEKETPDE